MAETVSPLNTNGVRLQQQKGQKILVTTKAFRKGDPLLIVPSESCLLAHRSGYIGGLQGQTDQLWDEVGDLREPLTDEQIIAGRTWDVQLALALLDATAGTGLGGDLWDQYSLELPKPEDVTVPFCYGSIEMLDEVQCATTKMNALKQQKRLRNISPEVFNDHLSHRITAASLTRVGDPKAVPTPLQWAFAMVRSRCFKVAQDWFAVVPVIDMANHSLMPSARFEVSSEDPALDLLAAPETVFLLRAVRDLQKGEEVTICYDQKYTNERLFVQYGFSMSGNPNDDVFPVPADSETASTSTSTSSTRGSLHDPNRDSERSLPAALLGGVDAEGEVEVEVVVGVEVEVKSSRSDAESGSMSSILQAADRIRAMNRASGSSDADATPMQLHSVSRSLLRKIVQRSVSRQQSESASKDRNVLVEESTRSLLLSLLEEVQTLRAGYPSSLGEDSSLLLSVQSGTGPLVVVPSRTASAAVSSAVSGVNSDSTSTSTAEESSAVMLNRAQLEACIRQRIERKQLLLCAHNVLNEALSALNA